jgi:hypothetical protein
VALLGALQLYNLTHRGFTAEPKGQSACCFDFYK